MWAVITLVLVLAFALIAAVAYIAWRGFVSERDMARRQHLFQHSVLTNDIVSNDVKAKGLTATDLQATGILAADVNAAGMTATDVEATNVSAVDVSATDVTASSVNASAFNLMSGDGSGRITLGARAGHIVAGGNVGAYGDVYARGMVAGSGGVVLSSDESPFAQSASSWAIRTDAKGLSISHSDRKTGVTRASIQTTPAGNVVFPGKICDGSRPSSAEASCIDIRTLLELAGKVDTLLKASSKQQR